MTYEKIISLRGAIVSGQIGARAHIPMSNDQALCVELSNHVGRLVPDTWDIDLDCTSTDTLEASLRDALDKYAEPSVRHDAVSGLVQRVRDWKAGATVPQKEAYTETYADIMFAVAAMAEWDYVEPDLVFENVGAAVYYVDDPENTELVLDRADCTLTLGPARYRVTMRVRLTPPWSTVRWR